MAAILGGLATAGIGAAAAAGGSSLANGLMGGGAGKGNQFQAHDVTGVEKENVNNALAQQESLMTALQGQNGIGNQSSVFNQLQNVASGQGPNPAQAMLANQTGANINSQAALMAGQRGSSANAGLMARQAAMQGGNLQQQAVGQGAAMQAQQSLGALGQMGGLSTQQVGQQMQATGANTSAKMAEANRLQQSILQQDEIDSGMAKRVAEGQNQAGMGLMSGLGSAAGVLGSQVGGTFQGGGGQNSGGSQADPNMKGPNLMGGLKFAEGGPVSSVGRHLSGLPMLARGGSVPAMVSPGEVYLPPKKVEEVAKGKNPLKAGEKIKGKAKVSGDSEANDTVKKNLKEGGIVIPRTKANDSDKAKRFVDAIVAKKGLKK